MSTASTRPGRTAGTATCSWTASECTTMRPPVRDLTLLLAHTLTYSPSHPLTRSHKLTYSHTHTLSLHVHPFNLSPFTHSPIHTLTGSPIHTLTHSLSHLLSRSPIQPLIHPHTHLFTHSPLHTLTHLLSPIRFVIPLC